MSFVRSTNVHNCPCGCGAVVPNRLYACRPGWARLPLPIKDMIRSTVKAPLLSPARLDALRASRDWYRDNPRGSES